MTEYSEDDITLITHSDQFRNLLAFHKVKLPASCSWAKLFLVLLTCVQKKQQLSFNVKYVSLSSHHHDDDHPDPEWSDSVAKAAANQPMNWIEWIKIPSKQTKRNGFRFSTPWNEMECCTDLMLFAQVDYAQTNY